MTELDKALAEIEARALDFMVLRPGEPIPVDRYDDTRIILPVESLADVLRLIAALRKSLEGADEFWERNGGSAEVLAALKGEK